MSTPRDKIEAKLGLTGPPLQSVRDAPPHIPDHELIRRIGQGAYGEVWLARNALGTWRAVKIVYRDNFKDARPYEREFAGIRRFEPLSRSNEGFVDVLQVGRDDQTWRDELRESATPAPDNAGGWFYYVMELADSGEMEKEERGLQKETAPSGDNPHSSFSILPSYFPRTLARDLHHRGRLPLEDCLQLGLTLTLALGHLHRHGLIHRDIKPSNIIFVGSVPKLADIGLVTAAAGANTFVGTEGFVPPEGPTSPQADLYALGKVLYEAAMGKDRNQFPEPFTQLGTDRESIALMELNTVLLRACAPDPKNRYATAEEMHADLALLHSGGSVKRRHQFERQFAIAKRVGGVAVAAAAVIGAAWYWQVGQTEKMTQLASEKAALATEKTTLAANLERLAEENRNRIVRLDIANGVRLLDQGDPAGALLWFADALPLLTNNPAAESIHRIRIQQTLDQTPRLLRVLPHNSSLISSAFSPDGRFIATGTYDGKLTFWNAGSGSCVWGPTAMGSFVSYVRFSRDGLRLFVCSSPQQQGFNGPGPMLNFFAVLDAKSGREIFSATKVLPGLSNNLLWSTFSPDDRWLAVSQRGAVVRLLDLRDGRPVTELRGHTYEVLFLSFSGDGTLLASASADKTVRLWRLPSGEAVGSPLEHRLPVMRAILTDDGRYLVTGSLTEDECELQVWNVQTGRRVGEPLKGKGGVAMFVEPGAGARFFGRVIGGPDDFTRVWHFDSFREALPTFEIPHSQCWGFSPDGKQVAIGGDDYTARVWSLETVELLAGPFRHNRWVHAVQFSPDGQWLLTGSDDGNARLWELKSHATESARGQMPRTLQAGPAKTFDARGRGSCPVPVSLEAGTMHLVDPDSLKVLFRLASPNPGESLRGFLEGNSGHCWAMNASSLSNAAPTSVFLWREEGGTLRKFNLDHSSGIDRMRFTPDDQLLVTCGKDHVIRFWRTADGKLERALAAPKSEGHVAAISPDVTTAIWYRIVAGERHDALEWLDLKSGKIIPEAHTPITWPLVQAEFSPDGSRLALGYDMGQVTVLNGRSGQVISATIKHTGNLGWVEWSPAGRWLLTAGSKEEVLVWDADTGTQLLAPLQLPEGAARVAHWSPDGRFVIGRSDRRQARVWDADTGETVTSLLNHSGDIRFAFMTRSHRLITASDPDLLRAWDLQETSLPPPVLADYAKLLSGHVLNAVGVMLPLKPDELAELNRSLRARAPQLFE